MSMTSRLAGALLVTTALVAPTSAFAQNDPSTSTDTPPTGETVADPAPTEPVEEDVDVSIPGGEIIVTGTRDRNITRSSVQVVSVLSSAEIARTGEGNIAGALGRVTGLSVVGSGYVYVRGLGDRYSLALLNGLPLPSPEPLRRVVPLDLFPSGVISSSLVQKSYSVNYPGEFGGGVINLTTKAVPNEPFFTVGIGISGDSETTGKLGYTYYGTRSDNLGFSAKGRGLPSDLKDYFSGRTALTPANGNAIAGQLVTARNAVVQRWGDVPPNFSASFSGGKSFNLGGADLGIILAGGYSNKYTNRDALRQTGSSDLSQLESTFQEVNTDQRIVVNGLFGLGLEFGENKVRWTNLYIRDVIKQARLSLGKLGEPDETPADVMRQRTAWYERQLIDTQLVGEFMLTPEVKLDLRGSYANSQRQAPFELAFEYQRSNNPLDPLGEYFVNPLDRVSGTATATFSELNEDLWAGGADLTYTLTPEISATVGGAYSDTQRESSRRQLTFDGLPANLRGVGLLRPDRLLSPGVVDALNLVVQEFDVRDAVFEASLRNWAGYGKVNVQITDELGIDAGVRFEKATQRVSPVPTQGTTPSTPSTELKREYWLPAATLTWQIQPELQFRLSASKTIARPQFRELIPQPFFDPDSNRTYRGNPLLVDSKLTNAEARIEYYFAPEQRVSLAGFYKSLDRPIEAFLTSDNVTSYANAPKATLYGAELEVQKYFELSDWGGEDSWFFDKRIVAIGNYTYTHSKLKVGPDDVTAVAGAFSTRAIDYFRDGSPLTGQSDHIINLQFGVESTEHLSQQTLLLSYASDRVASRGVIGAPPQPDVIERPGFRLDLVVREGYMVAGRELEIKFEARNITGTRHREFQQSGDNVIEVNTYDVGRTFALSAAMKF